MSVDERRFSGWGAYTFEEFIQEMEIAYRTESAGSDSDIMRRVMQRVTGDARIWLSNCDDYWACATWKEAKAVLAKKYGRNISPAKAVMMIARRQQATSVEEACQFIERTLRSVNVNDSDIIDKFVSVADKAYMLRGLLPALVRSRMAASILDGDDFDAIRDEAFRVERLVRDEPVINESSKRRVTIGRLSPNASMPASSSSAVRAASSSSERPVNRPTALMEKLPPQAPVRFGQTVVSDNRATFVPQEFQRSSWGTPARRPAQQPQRAYEFRPRQARGGKESAAIAELLSRRIIDPERLAQMPEFNNPALVRACFYCQRPGHNAFECPFKAFDQQERTRARHQREVAEVIEIFDGQPHYEEKRRTSSSPSGSEHSE